MPIPYCFSLYQFIIFITWEKMNKLMMLLVSAVRSSWTGDKPQLGWAQYVSNVPVWGLNTWIFSAAAAKLKSKRTLLCICLFLQQIFWGKKVGKRNPTCTDQCVERAGFVPHCSLSIELCCRGSGDTTSTPGTCEHLAELCKCPGIIMCSR